MSKKQRMPRNQQLYRRPTKAFQQNIAKNDPRMQMPEMPFRIILISIFPVTVSAVTRLTEVKMTG